MDGTITFELTGSGGTVRQYTLKPIQRKTAMWVMHTFLQTASASIAQGLDTIISIVAGSGAFRTTSIFEMSRTLNSITKEIDFEKTWASASYMLTGAIIRSANTTPIAKVNGADTCTVEIKDFEVDGADYFRDNPIEFYQAVFKAIDGNWPGFFIELRERIGDLKRMIAPGKKSEGSKE